MSADDTAEFNWHVRRPTAEVPYGFGPRLPSDALLYEEGTEDLDVPMLTGASRAELFKGKARARTQGEER